jgi:hypothetical protein
MLYRKRAKSHTKHINTRCGQNVEFLMLHLVVNKIATKLKRLTQELNTRATAFSITNTATVSQNYAAKHRPSTRQNICESLRVISVKHSSVLPDDGSHKIRNMSE